MARFPRVETNNGTVTLPGWGFATFPCFWGTAPRSDSWITSILCNHKALNMTRAIIKIFPWELQEQVLQGAGSQERQVVQASRLGVN